LDVKMVDFWGRMMASTKVTRKESRRDAKLESVSDLKRAEMKENPKG
jgi:hypothetical protein